MSKFSGLLRPQQRRSGSDCWHMLQFSCRVTSLPCTDENICAAGVGSGDRSQRREGTERGRFRLSPTQCSFPTPTRAMRFALCVCSQAVFTLQREFYFLAKSKALAEGLSFPIDSTFENPPLKAPPCFRQTPVERTLPGVEPAVSSVASNFRESPVMQDRGAIRPGGRSPSEENALEPPQRSVYEALQAFKSARFQVSSRDLPYYRRVMPRQRRPSRISTLFASAVGVRSSEKCRNRRLRQSCVYDLGNREMHKAWALSGN